MLVLLNILYIVLWICLLIFIFILFLFKEFVMTCIYAMRPTCALSWGVYKKHHCFHIALRHGLEIVLIRLLECNKTYVNFDLYHSSQYELKILITWHCYSKHFHLQQITFLIAVIITLSHMIHLSYITLIHMVGMYLCFHILILMLIKSLNI